MSTLITPADLEFLRAVGIDPGPTSMTDGESACPICPNCLRPTPNLDRLLCWRCESELEWILYMHV